MSFSTDRNKQKETMDAILNKSKASVSPQSTTQESEVINKSEPTAPVKQITIVPKKVKHEKKQTRVFALTDSEHKKLLKKAKEYGYVHANGQPNGSQFLSAIIKGL